MAGEFTEAERKQLSGHFSNADRSVFSITTPSQADRGALMSRYSRSPRSMRRIFLDEFLPNPRRGDEFYERVLSEYGDDSVAELGLMQVGIEGLSNVAVQTVEDRRIGLSFLEKSSRYVSWDAKTNGHFAYYRGDDIMESRHEKTYVESCEMAFETYQKIKDPMIKYMREALPIESLDFPDSGIGSDAPFSRLVAERDIRAARRIYESTLRARAFDVLRSLLPASALTNVGVAGNGRAFEYLISVLGSSPLPEVQKLGCRISDELKQTAGAFVRRARGKYGLALQKYMENILDRSATLGSQLESPYAPSPGTPAGRLVSMPFCDSADAALDMVVAGMLYGQSAMTFGPLHEVVRRMPREEKSQMVKSFAQLRLNRRHRPPRAFEMTSYVFDLVTNYGMFRDMHRHRILTLQRHPLSPRHGYTVPTEIERAGFSRQFLECTGAAAAAYDTIHPDMPYHAQYVVNFAYNYPYMIRVNLRELCHVVELRTLPQGHPDYREVAQQMYDCVRKAHPDLAVIMKFVNLDRYDLGRLGSEKRSERKRRN